MLTVYSLNRDWKYKAETDPKPVFDLYQKTGEMSGFMSDGLSDADWATVHLPHDWAVETPYDPHGAEGFKKRQVVWYRRSFEAPENWHGKRVFLHFDGIAGRSAVILNNMLIARSDNGYLPIHTEITALLYYGQPNLIAVRTDNIRCDGWWYDGGGINRNVWLQVSETSRFAQDGVFLSASRTEGKHWKLSLRTETEYPQPGMHVDLVSEDGKTLASVPAAQRSFCETDIQDPPLWSFDHPQLVTYSVRLVAGNGEILQDEPVRIGYREIRFDPEHGLYVNGRHELLKGTALHGDHAGVGVAVPYELQLYRLRALKEMGANAIRTAHNPQGPDFYRACDELGLAVMNETRHFGAGPDELSQLRTLVRRDRNHPCVFFWSLYNEEPFQCSRMGENIARAMKALVNEEDGTRPVAGGMNGVLEVEGVVNAVDMIGVNYMQYAYAPFHERFPKIPVFGSENASWLTQRGETETVYTPEALKRSAFGEVRTRLRGDTVNLYPWSATVGETWRSILKTPYVAGCFLWTGIDYRGETAWPGTLSDFGAMDLCCFPKDACFWIRSFWRKNVLAASRYPDPEHPGQAVALIWTDGDTVVLEEAGKEKRTLRHDPLALAPVSVVPMSEITVIAYRNGETIGQTVLRQPGPPAVLLLTCAAGEHAIGEATPWNVCLTDENGTVCNASDEVIFETEGCDILGVGNGDSNRHDPDRTDRVHLYHGFAQVITRALPHAEKLLVKAYCNGLTAVCTVSPEASVTEEIPACVPWIRIGSWRMSDIHAAPPEPEQIHDMFYNWIPTAAGVSESLMMHGKTGYATFAAEADTPSRPCTLHIGPTGGWYDLYLDGKKIMECRQDQPASHEIPLSPDKQGKHIRLSFLFHLHGSTVKIGDLYLTD